jgi:hypothetical protein
MEGEDGGRRMEDGGRRTEDRRTVMGRLVADRIEHDYD